LDITGGEDGLGEDGLGEDGLDEGGLDENGLGSASHRGMMTTFFQSAS
jgi:hypothetical protein